MANAEYTLIASHRGRQVGHGAIDRKWPLPNSKQHARMAFKVESRVLDPHGYVSRPLADSIEVARQRLTEYQPARLCKPPA